MSTFNQREWENLGQSKRLRGYNIKVLQWNSGKNANFYVEAHGDSLHGMSAPSFGKTVPGRGPEARDRAISLAKELANSGMYNVYQKSMAEVTA